jgi:hypothetical protein
MSAAQLTLIPLLRRLDRIVTGWHRLIDRACDSYRPERHYMRGPGPRCAQQSNRPVRTAATPSQTTKPSAE